MPLDFTAGSSHSHDVVMRSPLLKPRYWLLLLSTLVITIIGAIVLVRTNKDTSRPEGRAGSAGYVGSEVPRPAIAVRGGRAQPNPAAQKAGPPDPAAQKRATLAAASAADAAAQLAASNGSSNY